MTPEQIILLVLGVLLGLPALILLILSLARAKLHIRLQDELSVTLQLFGFRIPLWGEEKRRKKHGRKKLKRCRSPYQALAKEVRDTRRAIAKRHRKVKKKTQKKVQKKKKKAKLPKLILEEQLELLVRLIAICYRRTYGHLRVRVRKLRIYVGTSDACKTAIVYGAVAQSVAYLLEWIDARYAMILYDRDAVNVVPDFTSEESHANIDLTCSLSCLRVWLIYQSVTEDYHHAKCKVYKDAIQRRKQELLAKKLDKKYRHI